MMMMIKMIMTVIVLKEGMEGKCKLMDGGRDGAMDGGFCSSSPSSPS